MAAPTVQYLSDSEVNEEQDQALRELLSLCFTKSRDTIFRHRRYHREIPPHRWVIFGQDGKLAAHLAMHEKYVMGDEKRIPVGGIGEVCVHPDFRGRSYVRHLLEEAHSWLRTHDFPFALLFGATEIYASSGYVSVENLSLDVKDGDEIHRRQATSALVAVLGPQPWPTVPMFLPGLTF